MNWGSVADHVVTFAGGTVGGEMARWARGRKSEKAQSDVNHATAYNQLAQSVATLSGSLNELRTRFDATEEELSKYRQAQSRLETLFRHAIEVIRDFMDIAREHDIPAPAMSDELLDEIASRA